MERTHDLTGETLQSANQHQHLIGNTDARGTGLALPRRTPRRAIEPLPRGPIPVQDVRRRLFHGSAESAPWRQRYDHRDEDHLRAMASPRWAVIADRQAIVRPDTEAVMASDLQHRLRSLPVRRVAADHSGQHLDDTLAISSAGLLRGGAVASVEVSVPERPSLPPRDLLSGPTCWPPPAPTVPSRLRSSGPSRSRV